MGRVQVKLTLESMHMRIKAYAPGRGGFWDRVCIGWQARFGEAQNKKKMKYIVHVNAEMWAKKIYRHEDMIGIWHFYFTAFLFVCLV